MTKSIRMDRENFEFLSVEAYKKECPNFIQRLVAKQKARVKDS